MTVISWKIVSVAGIVLGVPISPIGNIISSISLVPRKNMKRKNKQRACIIGQSSTPFRNTSRNNQKLCRFAITRDTKMRMWAEIISTNASTVIIVLTSFIAGIADTVPISKMGNHSMTSMCLEQINEGKCAWNAMKSEMVSMVSHFAIRHLTMWKIPGIPSAVPVEKICLGVWVWKSEKILSSINLIQLRNMRSFVGKSSTTWKKQKNGENSSRFLCHLLDTMKLWQMNTFLWHKKNWKKKAGNGMKVKIKIPTWDSIIFHFLF